MASNAEVEFWRLPRVMEVTGLSKSEIYRRIKLNVFPPARHYPSAAGESLSRKATFWTSTEIRGWMSSIVGEDFAGLIG